VRRFRIVLALATAVGFSLAPASATAQSNPSPYDYMYDSRPLNGWPGTFPGESIAPAAVVVEGLGGSLSGCPNSNYTQLKIESDTVSWVNAGYDTVTEISPQSYCGSVSAFEALIGGIESYVEAHAPVYAPNYWGGFMLDEEPGYDFLPSSLASLNTYVSNLMGTTPGMSWWFNEAQPNGWTGGLSDYNTVLGTSYTAPQAYTQNMVDFINNECSTYYKCTNLVTVSSSRPSPWNQYSYVLGLVNGSAWSTRYWTPYGWWNGWRAQ